MKISNSSISQLRKAYIVLKMQLRKTYIVLKMQLRKTYILPKMQLRKACILRKMQNAPPPRAVAISSSAEIQLKKGWQWTRHGSVYNIVYKHGSGSCDNISISFYY